ncbi:MAG: WecB/TagA/CpsF family glycosyltransferase [Candidatus Omnitrophota bacterium]
MIYIAHRINTIEALAHVPPEFGVELDLRDRGDRLILQHDPFKEGEDFEEFLKHYHHGLMILNIKSERIELRVLELVKKYGVRDYFFLDSSFPMIRQLAWAGESGVAVRFSELEGMDTVLAVKGRVKWVWVDCFSRLPIDHDAFLRLKEAGFRLCLVSPELQGRPEDILSYRQYLSRADIEFDAVCSKLNCISMWQSAVVYDVLGVKISAVNPGKAEDVIAGMIAQSQKGYVCVAPVSTIMDCRRDADYCQVINHAAMVTPDGAPVAWLGRLAGHKEVSRTYGPELMERLCDHGRALGWRHFFYGGTTEACDRLAAVLIARFPGLDIVGKLSPPYMAKAGHADPDVVRFINAAKPDIIWVGLGAPKQDFWNAINRQALEAPVLIGIGAAFDFIAGTKPRAPRWMGKLGLEWLFRLCCEPRRLWRRYLVGNTLFVWLIVKSFLRGAK